MDCSTAQGLMLEFVEGALPDRVADGLREHIKSCPACMKELEKQSSRTRALQSLERVHAPDQWGEISRSIRRTGPWYYVLKYGVAALIFGLAAVAAIILASYLIPKMRGDEASSSGAGDAVPPASARDVSGQ